MRTELRSGSALLLAIMVISVLTTTTLGAIAIRFDQLLATDRITSASKAKLAADSGLVKLREKLSTAQTSFAPEAYDLTSEESVNIPPQGRFRPNPRHSVYSLESQVINLPRCLAVAVLSPWVNTGTYLLDNDDSLSNPALLFYYANIINDTPLGTIGSITNNSNGYSAIEKERSLSELTKLGQFYNPYAPSGYQESNRNYWTVKLGGPQDEFLYKKDATGTGSFYRNLDFVYIPYLPRFTDTGILRVANQPDSGLIRKSATEIRDDFENVIKNNNLKVWLDASVTNDLLYQYGLADLFTDAGEESSRVTWLQPSLWNDLPEADTELGYASGLSGPYTIDNISGAVTTGMQWQRQSTPTKVLGADDAGWSVEIARGSKSLSFIYPSGDLNRTITPNSTISFNVYGSLEGLRLNQPITVTAIDKSRGRPIALTDRDSTSQGRFYNVRITSINRLGNGEVAIQLSFFNGTYQTPTKLGGGAVRLAEIAVASLQAGPQHATERSVSNATLRSDGRRVTIPASSCEYSETSFVVCPAVGDVVNLSKPGSEPVWGRVTEVSFDGPGRQMVGFTLDKFREMPLPTRELASTIVNDGGAEKVAYYGGITTANEFDGGVNGVNDGFWLYNATEPNQNAAWTYLPNTPAAGDPNNLPGPRAGASIAAVGSSIYLFGGYLYSGVGEISAGKTCADNYYLTTCLGLNRPGARVAKVFPSTMFRYDLTTRQWSRVNYDSANNNQPTIPNDTWLELKTVSRFADRSGKDGWQTRVTVNTNNGANPVSLSIDPNTPTTLTLTTSNAGVAVGDEVYLNGSKTDGGALLTWGRVVGLPAANAISVKTYGIKEATGSVSLRSLSVTVLNRTKGSAKCIWQDATKSCRIDVRVDGIGLGDAVVLEHYDSYTNPTQLQATYAGYVSSINGNVVNFNSLDINQTNDYQTGVAQVGESVRLLPIGRANGKLSAVGTKLYFWQGDQPQNASNARTVDIWEFETANNRWSPVPLAMGTLPAGNLTFQSVRMPGQATVFTSNSPINNEELIKSKEITWDNNGTPQTEIVWDDAKTWRLEVSDESGNYSWNRERVTEGATIIIERQSSAARERFTGIVAAIDPNNQSRITVRHHPSYSGDGGLVGHSANAKIAINYPGYSNTGSVSVSNAERVNVDSVQVDNGASAIELRKIPVGAIVMAYSGSLSGTNTTMMTATVDSRVLTGANRVVFSAAGPAFMTTGLQESRSTNILVGGTSDDKMALSYQTYRPKHTQGAMEWVNNITGTTNAKKWVGRFPSAYSHNGSNRPAPRQNGTLAVTPDRQTAFIAGGTFGPYANVWRLQNAQRFTGPSPSWTLGKSSVSVTTDIPNLYGSTTEVTSTGKMVMFGGQRRFNNTTLGPRLLGQPNGNTYVDGTTSIVDAGASTSIKASQFTNQLKEQYTGVAKESLTFTSAPTSSNICQFLGQENCDYQLMRHLGTLGRFSNSWGNSLAVVNPGNGFKSDSGSRSLILSGPTQSLDGTNGRWDQEGYSPYKCDTGGGDCFNLPFGSLNAPENNNSKTLMFAGFSRISGGGSILVTPVGVGRAITTGPAGKSYCARDSISKDEDDYYSCKSDSLQSRYMKWIPDSEDVLFLFNAAKALSSTDAYRVIGYYGGVVRGYLAVSVGSELTIQEIAP